MQTDTAAGPDIRAESAALAREYRGAVFSASHDTKHMAWAELEDVLAAHPRAIVVILPLDEGAVGLTGAAAANSSAMHRPNG